MSTEITPLEKAIAIAGSQTALARDIGTKQQNVWTWLRRNNKVPAEFVPAIERVTGVSKAELRPDIWDEVKP